LLQQLSRREKERQAREAEIVAAAEAVFCQKGFDGASMDEIAKAAQFTKRTVYQYFSGKEDLYFAVALKQFQQLLAYFRAAVAAGDSGFEKIRRAGLAYYQYYKDHPDTFLLLYTGFIQVSAPGVPQRQKLLELKRDAFRELSAVFEEGKADGSIRADLDGAKAAYSFIFVHSGFFQMFSESGHSFAGNHGLGAEEFILFTLGLLSDAVRA
jgi:AcrR family transcriptional regulator